MLEVTSKACFIRSYHMHNVYSSIVFIPLSISSAALLACLAIL